MDWSTFALVVFGLCYSTLLLLASSLVIEDVVLSYSAKVGLILLILVLPIIGLLIAYFNTHKWPRNRKTNSHSHDSIVTGDTSTSSSDCGGGSD